MPTMKITPRSDWTLIAVFGEIEHRDHSHQPQRHGTQDDQRGQVGAEERGHQEVDQQGRQDQTETQAAKGLLHSRVFAAELDHRTLDRLPLGGVVLGIVRDPRAVGLEDAEAGNHAGHVVGHMPEVAARRRPSSGRSSTEDCCG